MTERMCQACRGTGKVQSTFPIDALDEEKWQWLQSILADMLPPCFNLDKKIIGEQPIETINRAQDAVKDLNGYLRGIAGEFPTEENTEKSINLTLVAVLLFIEAARKFNIQRAICKLENN